MIKMELGYEFYCQDADDTEAEQEESTREREDREFFLSLGFTRYPKLYIIWVDCLPNILTYIIFLTRFAMKVPLKSDFKISWVDLHHGKFHFRSWYIA